MSSRGPRPRAHRRWLVHWHIPCIRGHGCGHRRDGRRDPHLAPARRTPALPQSSPAPQAIDAAGEGRGAELAELAEARQVLVHQLIAVRDRVASDALRQEIRAALQKVGVHEIVVEAGTPFDPQLHIGTDAVAVPNPEWDQRVATTEHPGYYCGDCVLRPPSVVVYRFAG